MSAVTYTSFSPVAEQLLPVYSTLELACNEALVGVLLSFWDTHPPRFVLPRGPRQWDLQGRSRVSLRHFAMQTDTHRCWLAAYTRPRHEGHVAEQLGVKGVESLLPTYERFTRWSDRVRRSQAPLFPGYLFIHVSNEERVPVLQTVGVVNIVSVAGRPAPLADEDIQRLRSCGEHANMVEPHPFLKIGHRVRVKHGPFAGWEGVLIEKQNGARLVITVEQIMKSVAINLHGADVEPA